MAWSHSCSSDWDPMAMAHKDPVFNSYDAGQDRNEQANGGALIDNTKLYVKNIPLGVKEDGLRAIFATAAGANPIRVVMPPLRDGASKAFGFVSFANAKEARNALQALQTHNQMGLEANYQRLRVEPNGRNLPKLQMNYDTLAPGANTSPTKQGPIQSPSGLVDWEAVRCVGSQYDSRRQRDLAWPDANDAFVQPRRAGYYEPRGGAAGMNNLSPRAAAFNLNISAGSGSRTVSLGRGHFPPESSFDSAINGSYGSPRGIDPAAQARTKSSWSQPLLPCQMCLKPTADRCKLCKVTRYCSLNCSVKHWDAHKHTCMMICDPPGLLSADEDDEKGTVGMPPQAVPASVVQSATAPVVAVTRMPEVRSPVAVRDQLVNVVGASIAQSAAAPFVATSTIPPVRSPSKVQAPPLQASTLPIDTYQDIPLGQNIEVTVADREESTAWVVVNSRSDSSFELVTAIKASRNLAPVANPRIGDYVAAEFCGDWYRACVVKVSPLTVFYVDYGNTEGISLNKIRTLPAEFLNKPAQAIRIYLMPSTMGTSRTLEENQQLVVCAVRKVDNITHVKLGSDGQDTPTKTANTEVPKSSPSRDGSGIAVQPLGKMPYAAAVVQSPAEPATELPCQQFLQPLRKDQATKVYFVSKEGDNRYVQPITSSLMLGEMLKELEQLEADSALKPCAAVVGQVVVTKFDEDWSRCKILSIEKNNIEVIFIDYGNKSTITVGEIRELPEKYTHIPGQCTKVHFTEDTPVDVIQLDEFKVFSATLFAQARDGSLIVRAKME